MNKIIILLMLISQQIYASDQEGTGTPSTSSTTQDDNNYEWICTPIAQINNPQNTNQYCQLVPVQLSGN